MTGRSEDVGHQGGGAMGIRGICLAKLGTHPLFLHAELHQKARKKKTNIDEPAHLGEGDGDTEEPDENAGIDR